LAARSFRRSTPRYSTRKVCQNCVRSRDDGTAPLTTHSFCPALACSAKYPLSDWSVV
jgi:hypothetical protein